MTWFNSFRPTRHANEPTTGWKPAATATASASLILLTTGCVVPVPIGGTGSSEPSTTTTDTGVSSSVSEEPGPTTDTATADGDITADGFTENDSVSGSVTVDLLFNECVPDALIASNVTAALRPCASGRGLNDLTRIIDEYDEDELRTVYNGSIYRRTLRLETGDGDGEPAVNVVLCLDTEEGLAEHVYTVGDFGTPNESIIGVPEDPMWGCST